MAAPELATEDVAFMAAPTESPTTVAQTTTTTTTTTTPPTGPEHLTSYLDLTSSQEISGEWTIDSLNLYLTPSQLSDIQQISGNKKDIYTTTGIVLLQEHFGDQKNDWSASAEKAWDSTGFSVRFSARSMVKSVVSAL